MNTDHNYLLWFTNLFGGSVILSTIAGIIPPLGAFVAIVWYSIQIYESATVKNWRAHRRMRKLARLKARVMMMEARSNPTVLLPPGMGD